jgi:Holliday junction resolvasome RuvABC ATP-dependent DNA helicase subunit
MLVLSLLAIWQDPEVFTILTPEEMRMSEFRETVYYILAVVLALLWWKVLRTPKHAPGHAYIGFDRNLFDSKLQLIEEREARLARDRAEAKLAAEAAVAAAGPKVAPRRAAPVATPVAAPSPSANGRAGGTGSGAGGDHVTNVAIHNTPPSVTETHHHHTVLTVPFERLTEPPAPPTDPGPTIGDGTIHFEPGEPRWFRDYEGQRHVLEKLLLQLDGMKRDEPVIRPQLFKGPGGQGKTLLARITAHEWFDRLREEYRLEPGLWIEVWPEAFDDLDTVMQLVVDHPYSALFADEIHMWTKEEQTQLYEALNARRYQFKGHTQATRLPPTLFLAATTDAGQLEMPFLRRWEWHDLRPATSQELETIFQRRCDGPYDAAAIALLVDRTHHSGAPWEGLALLRLAEQSARGLRHARLEVSDIERVFQIEQLDSYGLRWIDRQVMRALFSQPKQRALRGGGTEFVCYAASEANLCLLAGVDKATYREAIRPRLMSRRLLELRPYYGQALTARAITLYRDLLATHTEG